MKTWIAWVAGAAWLAGLSACAVPAASPTQVAQAEVPPDDVVCFFEAPTGTLRKVKRCMSKDEYNKGMESAQRLGNDIRPPPPPPQ